MLNTYPEPYRSAKKDSKIDPSTCYNRECTSYCAWKIKEATGNWPKRTGDMNAKNWIYRLPENGYKTKLSAPNGNRCVGVRTVGKYGHVVWSEGTLDISEYNWDSKGNYGERRVAASSYSWYLIASKAQGFLPNRGYWQKGDRDPRVGELCWWYAETFPAYFAKNKAEAHKLLDGNYFGNNCYKWTVEFQKRAKADGRYNSTIDGKVGPKTYAALKSYGFTG